MSEFFEDVEYPEPWLCGTVPIMGRSANPIYCPAIGYEGQSRGTSGAHRSLTALVGSEGAHIVNRSVGPGGMRAGKIGLATRDTLWAAPPGLVASYGEARCGAPPSLKEPTDQATMLPLPAVDVVQVHRASEIGDVGIFQRPCTRYADGGETFNSSLSKAKNYHCARSEFTCVPPTMPPPPQFVIASAGRPDTTIDLTTELRGLRDDDVQECKPVAFSVGSAGHATGTCRPCAHIWRPAGCSKGAACERCHLCGEDAFRKYRAATRRAAANARITRPTFNPRASHVG